MMLEVMVAAVVGVMFANTWMCVLMSLSCAAEGENASKMFIVGRIIGVLILGLIISSLRLALQGYMHYIILAFGIITIAFAGIVLGRQYLERRFKQRHSSELEKGCSSCTHSCSEGRSKEAHGTDLGSDQKVLGNKEGKIPNLFWDKCNCGLFSPIDSSCDHGEDDCGAWMQVQGCENGAEGASKPRKGFLTRYGFSLGLFRGLTPCAKIVLLSPLIISVDFVSSIVLILVYAGASTIYPLMGMMSAKLMGRVKRHQALIRLSGAMILIGVGIYSIIKFLEFDVNQPH